MNIVVIEYENYKGETKDRRIRPEGIVFESTEFHPIPQWLLVAYDLDKEATRRFAMKDIRKWTDKLASDQEQLAASYYDNCWDEDLKKLIGSAEELKRINEYRNTDWSQDQLDEVIKLAIKWREEGF